MNDSKKRTAKKIVLKNRKEAARILSRKNSDKNQKKPVFQNKNKNEKTSIHKKEKLETLPKQINNHNGFKVKREKLIIEKDDLIKEEPLIFFKEKKENTTKEKKRNFKKLKKLEQRKEKIKLKQKQSNEEKLKNATIKKKRKEKQNDIPPKFTKLKQIDIKEKIKNSIYEEEIEEQNEINKKKKADKSTVKAIITFIVLILLFLCSVVVVNKLKGRMKSTLNMYTAYNTGEVVLLKDSSKWYVIADSSADKSTVKLLKELPIDINKNGNIDAEDQIQYSKDDNVQYNSNSEGSIANYLETKYKIELAEKVGKIEDISLLTSEEYVKARNKMGYSYEWTEGNWLASPTVGIWWLGSSKKNGVLVVTTKGNYKLYSTNQQGYVRPVITIAKDLVKKG